MQNKYDWRNKPKKRFTWVVGSKKYIKERNAFFKKNGGRGFEYHGWWYLQGYNEKYFLVNEEKAK